MDEKRDAVTLLYSTVPRKTALAVCVLLALFQSRRCDLLLPSEKSQAEFRTLSPDSGLCVPCPRYGHGYMMRELS